ncbi:transcription initiation factor TFIID subunit 2 [Nematocida sp. AWRm77]|nr:transcription initiation factor TFIID subunit 2 [Nematocida sp. AWRm77]
MEVCHQKNILCINTREKTYSGTSIFTLENCAQETLSVRSMHLHIVKIEHWEKDAWREVGEGFALPKESSTAKIRVLFTGERHNQSISFYEREEEAAEFVGAPVHGKGETLFPVIADRVQTMEIVYIVPNVQDFSVASSGVLTSTHDGGSTKTFHYVLEDARPNEVVFSGGVYEETHSGKVAVFLPLCLSEKFSPGKKEALEVLRSSVTALHNMLDCKLPFPKLYVVFTMCEVGESIGRNCAVLHISQSIVPEAIDQCFASIQILTRVVARQYFGVHAYAVADADVWMYTGLSEYLSMYLLELFLGANEVKYQTNRSMEYVHRKDVEEAPLSSGARKAHTFGTQFFVKKASAVIRVLESNLTQAFMHKIMKELLETRTASTQEFISIVKGITGKDVRFLFDFYVFRSGIPTIIAQIEQNSRGGGFSITLRQKHHSVHPESNRYVTGNICVRVYETDSVLDHVLFIGSAPITHEILAHQRSSRRKQKGEESSSILWVRVDPGLEWLKVAVVEQTDYMFAEQLASEKDVYGQMEALAGMQKNPSEPICTVLERIMADTQMFYKVSLAAGVLLAKSINEESGYFGFQRVIQFFITNYCIQSTTIVKTNDFSQFRSYFMQKNIAASMSLCQLDSVKTLGDRSVRAKNIVSAFLLNLMRYNDNTGNAYEDSFYLADIITALSVALCSEAYLDIELFVSEIEKLRKKDLLFPSHQNVITCAAIKALGRLAVQGYIEISPESALMYTDPGNFYKVRMAAYENLVLLHSETALGDVLDRAVEECRIVRVHILKTVKRGVRCAILPLHAHMQEHGEKLRRLEELFSGDVEIEACIREIVQLLTEPTEVTGVSAGEEYDLHDLSSEEPEAKTPKLSIKLAKPLIVKIPLHARAKAQGRSRSVHAHSRSVSAEKHSFSADTSSEMHHALREDSGAEEAGEGEEEAETLLAPVIAAVTPEEIESMHQRDEYVRKHFLDRPNKEGLGHLLKGLLGNKVSSHIAQNAKKLFLATGTQVFTFDQIPFDHFPRVEIESLSTRNTEKEDKGGNGEKGEKSESGDKGGNGESESGDKEGLSFHALHFQVLEVFRGFFTTMTYDTSAYSTAKYFQTHFEKEYAAVHKLSNTPFFKVDSETPQGLGRAVLVQAVAEIMQKDEHRIFSVPLDLEGLKPFKYLEIIRRPIDLLTIKTTLEAGGYFMAECVCADILLVFDNCMLYNLKESGIYKEAEHMKKLSLPLLQSTLSLFQETVTLSDALSAIARSLLCPEYQLFHDRVDGALYPQYYHVVQEPMCLSQIADRCTDRYYKNISHFESDVHKIHNSSLLYNGALSDITKLSKKLEKEAQQKLRVFFPWHRSAFTKRQQKSSK